MQARIATVPPEIGYYLAGFTDGEGSFNISFRPAGIIRFRGRFPSVSMYLRKIGSYSLYSKDILAAERFVADQTAFGILR